MAKSITFVTGERLEYDLCPREQKELLDSLKDKGLVQIDEHTFWTPDPKFVKKKVHYATMQDS